MKNKISNSNFTDDLKSRLDIVKERIGELKYKSKEKIQMMYKEEQWGVTAEQSLRELRVSVIGSKLSSRRRRRNKWGRSNIVFENFPKQIKVVPTHRFKKSGVTQTI